MSWNNNSISAPNWAGRTTTNPNIINVSTLNANNISSGTAFISSLSANNISSATAFISTLTTTNIYAKNLFVSSISTTNISSANAYISSLITDNLNVRSGISTLNISSGNIITTKLNVKDIELDPFINLYDNNTVYNPTDRVNYTTGVYEAVLSNLNVIPGENIPFWFPNSSYFVNNYTFVGGVGSYKCISNITGSTTSPNGDGTHWLGLSGSASGTQIWTNINASPPAKCGIVGDVNSYISIGTIVASNANISSLTGSYANNVSSQLAVLSNFSTTFNPLAYSNWSLYPAEQDVNFDGFDANNIKTIVASNANISSLTASNANISSLNLSSLSGGYASNVSSQLAVLSNFSTTFNPTAYSNWSQYPARNDLNFAGFNANSVGTVNTNNTNTNSLTVGGGGQGWNGNAQFNQMASYPYWHNFVMDANITTTNATTRYCPTNTQYFSDWFVATNILDPLTILPTAITTTKLHAYSAATFGGLAPTGYIDCRAHNYRSIPILPPIEFKDYRGQLYFGTEGYGANAYIGINFDSFQSQYNVGTSILINADSASGLFAGFSRITSQASRNQMLATVQTQIYAGYLGVDPAYTYYAGFEQSLLNAEGGGATQTMRSRGADQLGFPGSRTDITSECPANTSVPSQMNIYTSQNGNLYTDGDFYIGYGGGAPRYGFNSAQQKIHIINANDIQGRTTGGLTITNINSVQGLNSNSFIQNIHYLVGYDTDVASGVNFLEVESPVRSTIDFKYSTIEFYSTVNSFTVSTLSTIVFAASSFTSSIMLNTRDISTFKTNINSFNINRFNEILGISTILSSFTINVDKASIKEIDKVNNLTLTSYMTPEYDSWSDSTTYQIGNKVSYNGNFYTAVAVNLNQIPGDNMPLWVNGGSYNSNNYVGYSSEGTPSGFKCIQNVSGSSTPPGADITNWVAFSFQNTSGTLLWELFTPPPDIPSYILGDELSYIAIGNVISLDGTFLTNNVSTINADNVYTSSIIAHNLSAVSTNTTFISTASIYTSTLNFNTAFGNIINYNELNTAIVSTSFTNTSTIRTNTIDVLCGNPRANIYEPFDYRGISLYSQSDKITPTGIICGDDTYGVYTLASAPVYTQSEELIGIVAPIVVIGGSETVQILSSNTEIRDGTGTEYANLTAHTIFSYSTITSTITTNSIFVKGTDTAAPPTMAFYKPSDQDFPIGAILGDDTYGFAIQGLSSIYIQALQDISIGATSNLNLVGEYITLGGLSSINIVAPTTDLLYGMNVSSINTNFISTGSLSVNNITLDSISTNTLNTIYETATVISLRSYGGQNPILAIERTIDGVETPEGGFGSVDNQGLILVGLSTLTVQSTDDLKLESGENIRLSPQNGVIINKNANINSISSFGISTGTLFAGQISSLQLGVSSITNNTMLSRTIGADRLTGGVASIFNTFTNNLYPNSSSSGVGYGATTAGGGFYNQGNFRSTFTQVIQGSLDNNAFSNVVRINGNVSTQNVFVSTINFKPYPFISTLNNAIITTSATTTSGTPALTRLQSNALTFPFPGTYKVFQEYSISKGSGGGIHGSLIYASNGATTATVANASNWINMGMSACPFHDQAGVSTLTTAITTVLANTGNLTRDLYYYDSGSGNYTASFYIAPPQITYIPSPGIIPDI